MAISFSSRRFVFAALGIIFVLYVLFQTRFLILGPQVYIDSPQNDSVATSSMVTISGRAANTAWLSLNGRQIFTDEEGRWSEQLILSKGSSIMSMYVRDRFGREAEKSVRIIYN